MNRLTPVFRCTDCCALSGETHDPGCPQGGSAASEVVNVAKARAQWVAYYTRTLGTPPQPMDEARCLPQWLEATRLALASMPPVAKIDHGPTGSLTKSLPALAELPYGEHLLYTRPPVQGGDTLPPGWGFHSSDFIDVLYGRKSEGVVMLMRDESGRNQCNSLPADSSARDSQPIYVWGRGRSFHLALQDAIRQAGEIVSQAAPATVIEPNCGESA